MSDNTEPLLDCPFCKEKDFDLIGLKYHLQHYCPEYSKTQQLMCVMSEKQP